MRRALGAARPSALHTAALALALVSSASVAPVAVSAATGGDAPEYVERLQPPARGDRVGRPAAVHADHHTGEIFVADQRMNRILIFDERGLFRYEITGGSVFRAPSDLAVDPEGFILVLGNLENRHTLFELDFDGVFRGEIDVRGADLAPLDPPRFVSVALSPDGSTIYLADEANLRIWMTDRSGSLVDSIDLLSEDEERDSVETILGKIDVYGSTLLVSIPTGGDIVMYDLDGTLRGSVGIKGSGPRQAGFPVAGALDESGRVLMIDQQRTLVSIWDPEANRCVLEFSGIGRRPGGMYRPNDIALDKNGRVYTTQGFEGRVQVYEGAVPAPPLALDADAPGRAPVDESLETRHPVERSKKRARSTAP